MHDENDNMTFSYTFGRHSLVGPAGWSRTRGSELDSGIEDVPTKDLPKPGKSLTSSEPDSSRFSGGKQPLLFSLILIKPSSCSHVDSLIEGTSNTNDHIEDSSAAEGQPE